MIYEEIELSQYIYKKPYYGKLTLYKSIQKKNQYYAYVDSRHMRVTTFSKQITEDLIGCVFICENTAYKIISLDIDLGSNTKCCTRDCWVVYFTIKKYTDAYVTKLQERQKNIKEHLLVYMDHIEELGGKGIVDKIRKQTKDMTLEDLV
jgi:hypothetical protein